METYRIPEPITCPTCLAHLSGVAHVGVGLAIPSAGDRTVCGYCGTLIVWTDTGARKATPDEEVESAMDPRMVLARDLATRFRLQVDQ